MSQAPTTTAPPPRNLFVTLFGLLTLLWGLAILGFFVYAIVKFDEWLNLLGNLCNFVLQNDPNARQQVMDGVNTFLSFFRSLLNAFFGVFAFIGLIGFLGGFGVTFRFGRALAILFTLLNAAAGGGALYGGLQNNYPVQDLIVPIVVLGYGVITFLVLLLAGGEFRRERGVEA